MKRIHNVKKTLALILAMMMVLTSTAFANWDQYQGDSSNTGKSDTGVTTKGSVTTVNLPNIGAWTGVDSEPLVYGSRVYAVYNGGTPKGKDGGARLACVDANDASGKTMDPLWTVQLDGEADNVSQISTPIIVNEKIMYTALLHYENDLKGTGTEGWAGNAVSGGKFSFSSSKTTATYEGLVLKGARDDGYYQPQLVTDLMVTSGMEITGTATLTNQATKNTYTLSASGYEGSNLTFYAPSENAPLIPAGTYNLEVKITTNKDVSGSSMKFLTSRWALYEVAGINSTSDKDVTVVKICGGNGQPNTPIKRDGDHLYFGIYEGDRCYYQYNTARKVLTPFTAENGDDFYYAGAVVHDGKVYFGSESGKLYICPQDNFAGGHASEMDAKVAIRSSITLEPFKISEILTGRHLYFTTLNGNLWRVRMEGDKVTDMVGLDLKLEKNIRHSTATPAISGDYLYVTTYGSNPQTWAAVGTVKQVPKDFNSRTVPTQIYSGDGVQCSPVVYATPQGDYVYFTTNVSNGTGYCYSDASGKIWEVKSQNYALQGFAMGTYYDEDEEDFFPFGVFGNDGNQLTIIK